MDIWFKVQRVAEYLDNNWPRLYKVLFYGLCILFLPLFLLIVVSIWSIREHATKLFADRGGETEHAHKLMQQQDQ
ncbi:MAG: hypothetical protein WD579_03765 [Candidatus Paceibacterota bacterium]